VTSRSEAASPPRVIPWVVSGLAALGAGLVAGPLGLAFGAPALADLVAPLLKVGGLGAVSLGVYRHFWGAKAVVAPTARRPQTPDTPTADAPQELVLLRRELASIMEAQQPDMIALVDALLRGAVRVRASDVHLHPLEGGTDISYRVHGVLTEVMRFPRDHHKQLVSRLKVLSRITIFHTDRPQDGHFVLDLSEGTADIRVSVLPTNHGERVVLRLGNVGVTLPDLATIGMPEPLLGRFRALCDRPQGIIFLTGPTGSGKTTTIYAALAHIKESRRQTTQIVTIEDPVEYDVPFLTQTQVNTQVGLTFAAGLRSILRQDPNVIMVGEIRDAETAHIAVQAGLTGHQIVTTVHAESAAGAFNRLIEMGVEPFLLASASLASVSQRLVRALCPHCRAPAVCTADETSQLERLGVAAEGFFTSTGCERCDHTGYAGRAAFFEMLEVTPEIRELMNTKVPTAHIHAAAIAGGMVPLIHAGIELARQGSTSLREVLRVAG
jgi:general secretion pathway protein E